MSSPSGGGRTTADASTILHLGGNGPSVFVGAALLGRSLRSSVREAVGGGAGLDDVAAEGEAVDDGGAEPGVGEGLGPGAAALVACDRDRVGLLAFSEDLEQQLGARASPVACSRVRPEQVDPGRSAMILDRTRSSAASTSSLTSLAARTYFTRCPAIAAAAPRPTSRWDLPVPLSPIRQSGSPLLTQAQAASWASRARAGHEGWCCSRSPAATSHAGGVGKPAAGSAGGRGRRTRP